MLAAVRGGLKPLIVDEYQDVNPGQEKLITLLSQTPVSLCVVADDDQSIYKCAGRTSVLPGGRGVRVARICGASTKRGAPSVWRLLDPGHRTAYLDSDAGRARLRGVRHALECWRSP